MTTPPVTPLSRSNDRVLDAMAEATVRTVIALYDNGTIRNLGIPGNRRPDIRNILTISECGIRMSGLEADHWLDHFGIDRVSASQSEEHNG